MGRRTARAAAQDSLTLRVLGSVTIERGGERLELPPSKKTRALLGYLLVERRAQTREHLCGLFWDLPDDPRGALRWSLSRLRPLLDEPGRLRVQADRERVQLDLSDARVDLHVVEALRARGFASAGAAELQEAADLFRGELLEGLELCEAFRFQAWCTARREEARKLHAEILRALAAKLVGPEALRVARKLVELEPADEAAHRLIISLLGKQGRPREAIAQYDACREILRSALGTAPSPETERVRLAVGTHAPATATAVPEAPRVELPRKVAPLVGRERELATLDGAEVAVVLGEPGIGKSRLLEEVARHKGSAAVLSARCYEAEQARPYGCMIEALRASSLLAQAGEVLQRELGALLSELAPAPAELDRARLFDAVAALLRGRQVLLMVDDLQWIDEASAALTHYVVRTASVRAVLAAREGELPDNAAAQRLLRTLRRERTVTQVFLGPLDSGDIRELLRTRGMQADALRVHQESAGNPLLALEMGRAVAEGRPVLSGGMAEALDQRLEAIEPAAQSLLAWAAALGRAVAPALLAAVTGRAPAEMVEMLGALDRKGLTRVHPDGSIDFAHDLMREAAYRRIPPDRRRLLHATLARAVDEVRKGDAALAGTVARQAILGGDDALAVRASVEAGEHAIRVFAGQEALAVARQALPLLPALPRTERLRAHLALLRVCVHADRRPEQLERVAQEVSRLVLEAEASGLGDVITEGLHVLSQAHYFRADDQLALQGSLRGAEAARSEHDPLVRAKALAQAGRCLAQLESDTDRAGQLLDDASSAAQSVRAEVPDILLGRGLLCIFHGDVAGAREQLGALARLSRELGDHWRETEAMFSLCRLALERHEPDEALRLAEAVLPVAEKMPEGDEPALARGLLALARLQLGGEGEELFLSAVAELRRNEARFRLSQLLLLHADLDLAAGRLDAAAAHAEEVRRLGGEASIGFRHSRAYVLLAELALARGDRTAARERLALALTVPAGVSAGLRARISTAAARAGFKGGTDAKVHRRT